MLKTVHTHQDCYHTKQYSSETAGDQNHSEQCILYYYCPTSPNSTAPCPVAPWDSAFVSRAAEDLKLKCSLDSSTIDGSIFGVFLAYGDAALNCVVLAKLAGTGSGNSVSFVHPLLILLGKELYGHI